MSKTTKTIIWLVIAVIIIGGIWYASKKQSAEKEPIKIGIVAALSGSLSNYGMYIKNGVDIALEEINQAGGINGRKLEIIYEDDKSDTSEAVNAASKLINIDKVSIIIGSESSNAVLAIAPLAEQAKVILFTPIASAAAITESGAFVFRNRESAALHGERMAELAFNKLNVKNVPIISVNSDNGLSYQEGFIRRFEELGGKIVKIDNYPKGESDFRAILTKLKGLNHQAIYLAGYAREMAEIIKQAEELGIKTQFLASVGIEAKDLFQIIKPPLGDDIIYTYPAFDPDDPAIADYQNKHEEKYGSKSEALTANSYDALKILASVLKICGEETACIRDELYKIKDYSGVGGMTTFDQNGDVIKPIIFKTIKNGQFVPYEE